VVGVLGSAFFGAVLIKEAEELSRYQSSAEATLQPGLGAEVAAVKLAQLGIVFQGQADGQAQRGKGASRPRRKKAAGLPQMGDADALEAD